MKRKCIACRHRIPRSTPIHLTRDGIYCYPCMNRIQATKGRMEAIANLGGKR